MNQKIKKYINLGFVNIKNNQITINPIIIKLCSDFNSKEEFVYNIKNNFTELKRHIKNKQIFIDLMSILCLTINADDYMEEFYYHSSLLDRLKSGALDDTIVRGSSTYYEILGIIFTIPIYINPDIKNIEFGIDKIEIPIRKNKIENELDAEFARGQILYQLLHETLKEDPEELQKHLLFAGHITAIKHYFNIVDGKYKFTSESLQKMAKDFESRETKEWSIFKEDEILD